MPLLLPWWWKDGTINVKFHFQLLCFHWFLNTSLYFRWSSGVNWCTFMGCYRTALISSCSKHSIALSIHLYSIIWLCYISLYFPLALQKPTAASGRKTNFWQNSSRWELCNLHIWPPAFSKLFLQGQPEASKSLDQPVHSPPDHEYRSCTAGIPDSHARAQGSSSVNTSKVLHVHISMFSPQLGHLSLWNQDMPCDYLDPSNQQGLYPVCATFIIAQE